MFRFPSDVDGWLLEAEGLALHEWAAGKRILEIGSYCGRSTICLAQSAREVVSIDPHDGRSVGGKKTLPEFLRNLDAWSIRDVVQVMIGTTDEVVPRGTFDGVFIDGCHLEDAVWFDIEFSERLLTQGGQLAFHDYWRGDPGVVRAVDRYIGVGGKLLRTVERVAFVEPRKVSRV